MRFLLLFFITVASLWAMEEEDFYINDQPLKNLGNSVTIKGSSEDNTACVAMEEDKIMDVFFINLINPSDLTQAIKERIEDNINMVVSEQDIQIEKENFKSVFETIKSTKGSINLKSNQYDCEEMVVSAPLGSITLTLPDNPYVKEFIIEKPLQEGNVLIDGTIKAVENTLQFDSKNLGMFIISGLDSLCITLKKERA